MLKETLTINQLVEGRLPKTSNVELRQLHKHYPELWERLKEWDKRTWRNFRVDYSVEELEARFLFEEECKKCGKPIKGKAFFTELHKRLEVSKDG